MARVRYVTIIGSVIGDPQTGYRTTYAWDGSYFDRKEDAVTRGFKIRESDDFNIGVMENGFLRSFWWMDEQLDEPPATLREIAQDAGLEPFS